MNRNKIYNMKSLYITIIVTLTFVMHIAAQEKVALKDTNTSNVGLKLGYNLAAVSFDEDSETGQRHGFFAGFYGESFLISAVAIQVELMYSQQGYQLKDNGGTFTQKLDYLNLPVSLKIYPANHFYLEAGPQIGLAISHKEEYDSNFGLFDTSRELEPEKFDWGFNFGTGFKTESGISLGVRYHLGMGSIYDEGDPKNRVWQFAVGIDF
ncbi:outer membrane protein with beta-barrel domain [Gelidibacter sediminis]|uniref:Outer membrane protein with beta-barrel domain n=2 Tax=Gelidibacter sediminis TaxID=1608710 RepID=A0A4R7Q137_9FLAO|nr:outer membrane protein with beta-barrel domain [Gelidibacter sediminis]